MKAFLTGATGFVGGHVLEALAEAGASVRCLVRSEAALLNAPPPAADAAERVVGDLTDPRSLERGMEGVDAVFHVAADYRLFVRDPKPMYASNVDGTRNVLEAAGRRGVGRIVYTSTVGTLGPMPDDSAADETSDVTYEDMVGHYKKSKFLAKRVAKEAAAAGAPVVIVHPSAPVGPRDHKPTATGKIILDFVNRKLPAFVDTGLNLVDVGDVARGHLLAAEKGRVGEEYILGHRNLTLAGILAALAEITGLPAPRVRLPHWIPLAIAALDTGLARILPRQPWLALEAVQLARHKMFFDPSKAVRELGLAQTPIEESLAGAVAWYRENGYVRGNG